MIWVNFNINVWNRNTGFSIRLFEKESVAMEHVDVAVGHERVSEPQPIGFQANTIPDPYEDH